jgi:two-component system sensor histidine kinase BarA
VRISRPETLLPVLAPAGVASTVALAVLLISSHPDDGGLPVALVAAGAGLGLAALVGLPVARSLGRRLAAARRERDEAEAQARARAELVAWVSHEVRTPLDGLLGYARLLERTPLTPEQRGYLHTALDAGTTLVDLANDLLDFARAEASRLRLQPVDFDPREVVESVLDVLAPAARAKGLELCCPWADGVPERVHGDPRRLRQVLTNLVSNAVKFTREGGVTVRVAAAPGGSDLRWAVVDTGPGLDAGDRTGVFEPFAHPGRVGLGLLIARTLVEHMGGRLKIESPERGTTVTFTLPLEPRPGGTSRDAGLRGRTALVYDTYGPVREATRTLLEGWGLAVTEVATVEALERVLGAPPDRDVVLLGLPAGAERALDQDPALRSARLLTSCRPLLLLNADAGLTPQECLRLGVGGSLTKPVRATALRRVLRRMLAPPAGEAPDEPTTAPPPPPRAPLPPGCRVLVADDSAASRGLVTALLEAWGARVTLARDGDEARTRLDSEPFDLVLMDLRMPGMDGEEVTARLRRQEGRGPRTPVVALTADALEETRRRALQAGVDGFLAKPADEESLYGVTTRWLAGPGTPARGSASIPGPRPNPPVLDRQAALRVTGGDPAMVERLLDLLLSEVPEDRARIGDAIARSDLEEVARVAHRLAGGAAYCGALALETAARALQQAARRGAVDAVAREALALDVEMDRLGQEQSREGMAPPPETESDPAASKRL